MTPEMAGFLLIAFLTGLIIGFIGGIVGGTKCG